jgi:molybdopterin-guanine dinucleotide biosynthesis protein A
VGCNSTIAKPVRRLDIAGVILAGGAARRMGGGDKCLIDLGGQPILAHIADRLRAQVGALVLNANGDAARFDAFGLPVIADAGAERAGPLAGVLAGLTWAAAQPEATAIVTVPSDVPFLPADLVARLADGGRLSVAVSEGRLHPTIAFWPLDIAPALAAALREGRRKATAFVEAEGARHVGFDALSAGGQRIDPFFNANTPEDLDAARRLLQASRS